MTTDPGDIDLRRIEYLPLRDLKADPRNPKAHAQDAISSSVTRFGFVEPIILDERTGYIASGHGRVSALTQMRVDGKPAPDGVKVSKKRGWLVPVVMWRSRNDMEAAAALIAFNRTGELGGWAEDALLDLLHDLEDDPLDIGFDADEIARIEKSVAEAAAPARPEADLEDVPTLRKVARTVRGDIWVLGRHRVICGDSTDPEVYAQLLGDERPDVMWTDPPYGVDYVGGDTTLSRDERRKLGGDDLSGDQTIAATIDLLNTSLPLAVAALTPGAAVYLAHADAARIGVQGAIERAGISYRQTLIWLKDRLVPGRADYQYIHEPIAYGFVPAKGIGRLGRGGRRWHGDDRQRTVIEVPRPGRSKEHPTMKPVALIEAMLRNSARAGHLILDIFGGSGSTLIAAEALGMNARVVELDPLYVDVIVDRWERLTGGKAHRVEQF